MSFAELEAMRDKFRALSVQSEDDGRELEKRGHEIMMSAQG